MAGQFRLNLPNYPIPGGWFFNPLSWQLLFTIGLLSGMAMKQGKRFVPRLDWLLRLCVGFIVLVVVWMKVPAIGDAGRHVLDFFSRLGVPYYMTWFDKTYLALPRLLHALALFYVVGSLPIMRQLAEIALGRAAAPDGPAGACGVRDRHRSEPVSAGGEGWNHS